MDPDSLELMEWCWTYMPPNHDVLHHAAQWNPDPDETYDPTGRTSCGKWGELSIPGLFSRMALPRCTACCDALGYPPGTGSPKNSEECRPLVEARHW